MLVQPTYNARHSAPVESGRIGVFLEDYCIPHAPRRRRMSLKSMEFPPIPSVSHIPYVPLTLFGPIWRFSGNLENSQEFHEFSGPEAPTTVLASRVAAGTRVPAATLDASTVVGASGPGIS